MDASIGTTYPAPRISPDRVSEQEFSRRFSNRAASQLGSVTGLAQRMSRKAARWLANRRVWSPRITTPSVSFQTRLTSELETVQRDMLARTGVDIAIGAAASRVVARTASRLAGAATVVVVPAGQERAFLAPLPLRRLDGLSEAELRVLRASGMVTIGELQRVPKAALQAEFGQTDGLRLWRAARGLDSEFATRRHVGVAGEHTAGAEARLLSGSLRAPWRANPIATWGWPGTGLLRRLRQYAGAR
jgi:hypothetical protein